MLFKNKEYKSIPKEELKETEEKYNNYVNEELTEKQFIKKYGEEALKEVNIAPITHEVGEKK